MDHLEDVKSRIRERLKKLDELKNSYKTLGGISKVINNDEYSKILEERIRNIESIKKEISERKIISQKSISTVRTESKNISRNLDTSHDKVDNNPTPNKPTNVALPPKPQNLPSSVPSSVTRSERVKKRDDRMRESRNSGCGCGKKTH